MAWCRFGMFRSMKKVKRVYRQLKELSEAEVRWVRDFQSIRVPPERIAVILNRDVALVKKVLRRDQVLIKA